MAKQAMIVVTGSSGFVGSRLRKFLPSARGIDLIPAASTDYLLDLRTSHLKQEINENVDIIVHLAGVQYGSKIPRWKRNRHFMQNVEMSRKVLEFANAKNVKRIIFVSTDMVYGKTKQRPIFEESSTVPWGPYGKSKLNVERMLQNEFKGDLVIFRPRLIMGPGRGGTVSLFNFFIRNLKIVPVLGNGNSVYQFIAIDDLCDAIVKSLDSTFIAGIYNIGSDCPPKLNDLIIKVGGNLGLKFKLIHLPSRITKYLLTILDFLGLSPLSPEQFQIADADVLLDTSKLKNQGWLPSLTDNEIFEDALRFLNFQNP